MSMSPYIKMPRQVVRATIALCVGAAAFGLWLGNQSVPSETDVIEAGAAFFVAETGGDAATALAIVSAVGSVPLANITVAMRVTTWPYSSVVSTVNV